MPEILRNEWDKMTDEEKYRYCCNLVMRLDTLEGVLTFSSLRMTTSDENGSAVIEDRLLRIVDNRIIQTLTRLML